MALRRVCTDVQTGGARNAEHENEGSKEPSRATQSTPSSGHLAPGLLHLVVRTLGGQVCQRLVTFRSPSNYRASALIASRSDREEGGERSSRFRGALGASRGRGDPCRGWRSARGVQPSSDHLSGGSSWARAMQSMIR